MDRIVRRKQLLELIGVSASTQMRMERAGLFPARVKVGKGAVGWRLVDVEQWFRDRESVSAAPHDAGLSNTNRESRIDPESAATSQIWKP